MTMNLSELAESVAAELATADATTDEPEIDSPLDEDDPLDSEQAYVFANKMRFAPKHDDAEVLMRCRAAAEQVFEKLFAPAVAVIDKLYLQMRVPRRDPNTGRPVLGSDGRPIWEVDPDTGRPVESLEQLTGPVMDEAILQLEYLLLQITPQVTRLRLEALYAQNTAKDTFDDAWEYTKGTQQARTSSSNSQAREDRWHSYFKFYTFSTANSFMQELKAFVRRLDSIRYRMGRRDDY